MKTLIIYNSIHHKNTEKIAGIIGTVIKAELKKPQDIDIREIENYDLIGFGSGIYMGKFHKAMYDLVEKIPIQKNRKAFIFSTSGFTRGTAQGKHKHFREKLKEKGFFVINEFNCPGWDSFGPLRLIGGINKDRPHKTDLEKTKKFAEEIIKKL